MSSCFIIVQQPSIPECFAATKYEKSNNCDAAKLFARIICLIDPSIIDAHLVLPSVGKELNELDKRIFGCCLYRSETPSI